MTTPTTTLLSCPPGFAPASAPSSSARPLSQWTERCAQAFFLAWVLFSVSNAVRAAFWFDGYPVNGPFQLYDPLRRMAAGQHAGQDFQFFHGIGIPFLHYPLFLLFGGHSLQASELSRQFTSLLLFLGSLAAFVYAATRQSIDRAVHLPWTLAASAVLLLELFFPHSAEPGHSLISGRSTLPLFAFAILQLRLRSSVKALLFGCCIGAAFFFGTEHGIALTLALLAVATLLAAHALLTRAYAALLANVRFVLLALVGAVTTGTTFFLAFCGRTGAAQALHYNLVELPIDQFWFFGSPPMPYITSLSQLVTDRHVLLCFLPSLFLVCLIVGLTVRSWKQPLPLGEGWRTLSLLMLTYGVLTAIPLIGILSRHYVYPQTRILILLVVVLVTNTLSGRCLLPPAWARRAAVAFITLMLLLTASLLYRTTVSASSLQAHSQEPARFDPALDHHWDSFMADATANIRAHQTRPQLSLWSEYAALLDARFGTFQPAEDYVIHAVGPERWSHYLQKFRATEPEFVTTMTSQFSFAEWLQDERWDFYENLIDNYEPLRTLEHATIWHRRPEPWRVPAVDGTPIALDPAHQALTLPPASRPGEVVVLQLHYVAQNPWRKLPLVGATPRFVARLQGTARNMAVSLPPYATTFRFPVLLSSNNPVTIHFSTESFLPGAHLTVSSADCRSLPATSASETLFIPRHIPSQY